MTKSVVFITLVACAAAAPAADLVDQVPGFDKTPFKVYSGYLTVPGPLNGYDELRIHYQFNEAQTDPASKPVVTWHQGGPGAQAAAHLGTRAPPR